MGFRVHTCGASNSHILPYGPQQAPAFVPQMHSHLDSHTSTSTPFTPMGRWYHTFPTWACFAASNALLASACMMSNAKPCAPCPDCVGKAEAELRHRYTLTRTLPSTITPFLFHHMTLLRAASRSHATTMFPASPSIYPSIQFYARLMSLHIQALHLLAANKANEVPKNA